MEPFFSHLFMTKCEQTWSRVFCQAGAVFVLAVMLGWLVNQIRSDPLPLLADWSVEGQLAQESEVDLVISLDEARDQYFSQTAVFLDARSPESYKTGHIMGAVNLPWEAVDECLDAVTATIPQDAMIIIYCDGEACSLSKDLALELFYAGYDNVRVLVNGWGLWEEHRLPVEKEK